MIGTEGIEKIYRRTLKYPAEAPLNEVKKQKNRTPWCPVYRKGGQMHRFYLPDGLKNVAQSQAIETSDGARLMQRRVIRRLRSRIAVSGDIIRRLAIEKVQDRAFQCQVFA